MTIITDPVFYMFAIPIVLFAGMAKGGLGPGIVAIAVPVFSFTIDPVQAAAIMLPILCAMDIFAVWQFRGKFSTYYLSILIPAGIAGIIIASLLMDYLPANAIRVVIGIIAILFCLDHWFRRDLKSQKTNNRFRGYFWGVIAGFTSTQIHAGGPPASIYLLPQKLDKVILIGTMAVFFTVLNYLKLIPYTIMGVLNAENLLTSFVLMPLAPVGVKLGRLALDRVSQVIVYRFFYIVLFLSGIKLLTDGVW